MLRILTRPCFHLASHSYESAGPDELNLKCNEIVVSSIENNGGWSFGFSNKWHGWFPLNYVTPIDDNFPSKKDIRLECTYDSADSYKTAVDVILSKEKHFLSDYKSSYEKISQTLASKTISSRLDSSVILRECERFIKLYETFVTSLEKELRKPSPKQRIGQVYLEYFSNSFCFCLNYCQIHPFFISKVLQNKKDMDVAYSNKVILMSVVSITKFFSVVFMRSSAYSSFLEELLNYINVGCMAYVEIKMAIAAFSVLSNGCSEVRKSYTLINDILPSLEIHLAEDLVNKVELSQTVVFIARVLPVECDNAEENIEHFLIFHVKKLFYVTSDSDSPGGYKILEVFQIEETILEAVDNSEELCNIIYMSCLTSDRRVRIVTETSDDQNQIIHVWRVLKNGKLYYPFWVTPMATPTLMVPRLPMISIKYRPKKFNQVLPSSLSQDNELGYERLKELIKKLEPISPTSSQRQSKAKELTHFQEVTRRMNKLEDGLNTVLTKLDNEQARRKILEDIIMRLTRLVTNSGV